MSKSHLRTHMLSNAKIFYRTLNSVMGTDVRLTGVNVSSIINTFSYINLVPTNCTTKFTYPHMGENSNMFWPFLIATLKQYWHACDIYSFILLSVLWQIHSLFQSEFSTQCNLVLLLSFSSIFWFSQGHTVAAYIFFLVLPSHPSLLHLSCNNVV